MTQRARRVAMLLLGLELLGIAWLVLNPSPATPDGAVHSVSELLLDIGAPTWMASTTGWEYLLNVALFVPLGLQCALVWDMVWLEAWVIVGFLVSCGLEVTQYLWLDQRSATLTDVSSNTVGMFVGAAAGSVALGVFEARRARRRSAVLVYD